MSKLRLITGQKGSAKTLWSVDSLFKEYDKNPDRDYYSDITNLKHSGVKVSPDDWRDIPDNSLIIYDEVQFKLLFSRHNSKRDTQILELTTMRKRGVEMWIITQRARFLNADVLGLVDEHVHLERNGQLTSKVYIFQEAEVNITKTKKLFAFDKYVYAHPQNLYGFYESIKEGAKHGKKSYINKQAVSYGIILLFIVIGCIYFISTFVRGGTKISTGQEQENKTMQQKAEPSKSNNLLPKTDIQQPISASNLVEVCKQAVNIDKPECVKWYEDLTQKNQSVSSNNEVFETVSYNPNKPYEFNPEPKINVADYPRVVGCAKNVQGKYLAIDQQGNLMPKVSESDCKKWFNGERPFDYTRSPVQASQTVEQAKPVEQNRELTPYEIDQFREARRLGMI